MRIWGKGRGFVTLPCHVVQGAGFGTEITRRVVEGGVHGMEERQSPVLWINGDVVAGSVVVRGGNGRGCPRMNSE